MTIRVKLRLLTAALLSALLSMALLAPAEAKHRTDLPDQIDLPIGFQPEGITIGKAPYAYLGSLADGRIIAVNLRTGAHRLVREGPGTPSVGLKIDRQGLLYVAGGPSGTARVVSARTGSLVADVELTDNPSFINDVVLTPRAAWFTDSLQAQLYAVPRSHHGKPAADQARTLTLTGDWNQVAGFNANGIEQTPDGKGLLVIQTVTGLLFRVDPRTGVATKVDLGRTTLPSGDGLLLRGRTLYVVQNQLDQVAVIKLNRQGTEGRLVEVLTSPDFDVPTTVAAYKGSLYLPNARFGVDSPETAEYQIIRIDR